MLTGLDLPVTPGEYCLHTSMRRLRLSDRVRAYVRAKFRHRGTAAQLSKYLTDSPVSHRRLRRNEVSMMFQTGSRKIDLDTLEDIAAFFGTPISELLGVPNSSDLTVEEQRIVHALRVLLPSARAHLLAIAEMLSIEARFVDGPARLPRSKRIPYETAEVPSLADDYDKIQALADGFDELVRHANARRQAAVSRDGIASSRLSVRSARGSHPTKAEE